jgi:hypothetical protein
VADRIGIVTEEHEEAAFRRGERLSYRASILINLAVSAALYGLIFALVRGIIGLF